MTVLDDVRALSVRSARRHIERTSWNKPASNREWDDASTQLPRSEAARRGNDSIDTFLLRGDISSATAARGRELIRFLFKPNTVYATIAPDDDGLSFYWAAAEMSLTIIVYADEYWWSVRNDSACDSYCGAGGELPLIQLQHSLNQFSKEVVSRNPEWRSLIS